MRRKQQTEQKKCKEWCRKVLYHRKPEKKDTQTKENSKPIQGKTKFMIGRNQLTKSILKEGENRNNQNASSHKPQKKSRCKMNNNKDEGF